MNRPIKLLLKSLTLTCVLAIVTGNTYAQNTGAVSPEYSSFESADANNMINYLSGDFGYVLPLLKVPGPEAGYPVTLFYHAGIAVDQEASWVGLGWNINPGAINRTVNMFPDDYNGDENITWAHNMTEDKGFSLETGVGVKFSDFGLSTGTRITYSTTNSCVNEIGQSFTLGYSKGSVGVGLGMYISHRKGEHGAYADYTAGVNVSRGIGSASVGIQMDGRSGNYASTVSVGLGPYSLSYTYNSSNGNWSSSLDLGQGTSPSISIGGLSVGVGFYNSATAAYLSDCSVAISSKGVTIPTAYWFFYANYGFYKTKCYFTQTENTYGYGALYSSEGDRNWTFNELRSDNGASPQNPYYKSDTYSIIYDESEFLAEKNGCGKNNLMFPAFDLYSVSAEGLNGVMKPRPVWYNEGGINYNVLTGRREVIKRNDENDVVDQEYYYYKGSGYDSPNLSPNQIYFYFDNEFSSPNVADVNFTYDDAQDMMSMGSSDLSYYDDGQIKSFNTSNRRKITGNAIEWYTNQDIHSNYENVRARGFIDTDILRDKSSGESLRDNADFFSDYGIGGFTITKEDGMQYHYSLPVYQYERFVKMDKPADNQYFEERNMKKYAYAWLLTSVTGPDYVDINNNGLVDASDYGYWVKFDYGKWTDGYIWQMPYTAEANKPYQWGRKQIYYLNDIQTRTHTAYFVKSLREDGLGKNYTEHKVDFPEYEDKDDDWTKVTTTSLYRSTNVDLNHNHKLLKLDRIIVVANENATLDYTNAESEPETVGKIYYSSYHIHKKWWINQLCGGCSREEISRTRDHYDTIRHPLGMRYFYGNMLTDYDIPMDFLDRALSVVDFRYDYSLNTSAPNTTSVGTIGRLTLLSVSMKGKGNTSYMPPYSFSYFPGTSSYLEADSWGFNDKDPKMWSLQCVRTPIGSTIEVNYESDSYNMEVCVGNPQGDHSGGGLRVKNLYLKDGSKINSNIALDYDIPGTIITSGVTSFEPGNKGYIPYKTEMPAPFVMYQYVTETKFGENQKFDTKNLYEYNVLPPADVTDKFNYKIGDYFVTDNKQNVTSDVKVQDLTHWNNTMRNTVISNRLNLAGTPKKITNFNAAGQQLNNTEYVYDANNYEQESYIYRKAHVKGLGITYNSNSSSRKDYKVRLSEVITKGPNGEQKVQYSDQDPITGQALTTTSTFSKNGQIVEQTKTTTVPAYKVPAYAAMGLKSQNITNKNMLTQEAATYTQKYINGEWETFGVGIQTWNSDWRYREYNGGYYDQSDAEMIANVPVWRKHKSFIWKGEANTDGSYKDFSSKDFNWSDVDGNAANGWLKASEITRYSHYSIPLESKDINGNYAASKMSYGNSRTIALASNANYNSFACTGFESFETKGGSLDFGSEFMGNPSTNILVLSDPAVREAHTGDYYLRLDGTQGPIYRADIGGASGLLPGRKYKASVWIHENSPDATTLYTVVKKVDGTQLSSTAKAKNSTGNKKFGKWILVNITFDVPATAEGGTFNLSLVKSGTGSAYIDDMRLQPEDAAVTASTYDDMGNVTAILDNDNLAVKYEYDEAGRLRYTFKETPQGFKKVSQNNYNYKRSY